MTADLVALAERAVAAARKAGADGAEAFVQRESGGHVTLERNDLSGAEWGEQFGIGLRVFRENRIGFAYVTRPDRIADGLSQAFQAGRLGKRLPRFRFPGPAKAPTVPGLWDKRVLDVEGKELVEWGGQLVDAVRGIRKDLTLAGGGASVGWTETAVANSEGLSAASRGTGASAHVYVVQSKNGVSTGFASRESTRRDLDLEGLGSQAGRLAVASQRPQKLARGVRWPCVVRPEPASDLFSTITLSSLEAKPAHRDESYYSGKVGRAVAHAKLSLVDDARLEGGLGSGPVDDEGVPSRAVRPIARGVLKTFLYDAATAHEYEGRLTASAVRSHAFDGRSYKSPPGAAARQVRIEGPRRPTEKLIAGLDDGLVLHDLMGVHTANTVSGDFSVTSSLLFRVRKGDVAGPVAPVGVAGNLHEAWRRGFTLGDDVKRMSGDGGFDLPSVLFEGFAFTP